MGLIFSNIPELEGTNTEISLANLSALEDELAELLERRLAHLCELARAIVSDGGDIDLIKSIIISVRSDGEVNEENICGENIRELYSLFFGISHTERLIIFKQIFEEIPNEKYSFSDDIEYMTSDNSGRIAYIRNSYNDSVYEHFSTIIPDSKAYYCESVTDVCESVTCDKCEFCILPIETQKDGKLISFYNMIIKYGLKINAEYDLKNGDGSGYTRYALIGKGQIVPHRISNKISNNRFLEISYRDTDNISPGELLTAADFFGLKVNNFDMIFLDVNDEKKSPCIEFSASNADIQTFLTYLSVDCPDHLLIGIYQRQ